MATQNITKIIDDLRDTIVGKIPMPNTQVEQITLALLYKLWMIWINHLLNSGEMQLFSQESLKNIVGEK